MDMSTRLVILGLLQDQPMYGYEIKQAIEEQLAGCAPIAFGSIYFALNQLAKEGLVEKTATEQSGSRPARTIYQISPAGEQQFHVLLREQWLSEETFHFDFDVALFFQSFLSSAEIVEALNGRMASIEERLASLDNHQLSVPSADLNPAIIGSILEHQRLHLKAELQWLGALKRQFPGG
jgi:DNA-binding PadR family transcriptional regulator